jgi:hypothetical protein
VPGGDAPPHPERRQQEHHLFCFFAAGVSAFETFSYALYAMGAILIPLGFPLATDAHRRAVDVRSTSARFTSHFAGDRVSVEMVRLTESDNLRQWERIRNILSHRQAPGRIISLTVGADDDRTAEWLHGSLGAARVADDENWLFAELGSLVDAAGEFAATHL